MDIDQPSAPFQVHRAAALREISSRVRSYSLVVRGDSCAAILLRVLERSAVLHLRRDTGRLKCVTAGEVGQGGCLRPPLDHR